MASAAGTLLAALAATGALWFTGQSLRATNNQLALSQQTAVTDRFRLAAEQLSSDKIDVRISGIYLFERLARDSSADHVTVYSVLAAFMRTQASVTNCPTAPAPAVAPVDIQVAMTVIARRDTSREPPADRPDLNRTCLANIDLSGTNLTGVNLIGANLNHANLNLADLGGAFLTGADLTGADLGSAKLNDNADLGRANLTGAELIGANLTGADLIGANLTGANLNHAYLNLANLSHAFLSRAELKGADLTSADLTGANLEGLQYSKSTQWPKSFTPPPPR